MLPGQTGKITLRSFCFYFYGVVDDSVKNVFQYRIYFK
uniref:Uncharacterized protein n=1 Tax=Rhizophora mucronata TaxID=61149 RepID=A0A2P2R2P6_RHIMU